MLPPFCNSTLNPVTSPALCFRSSCLQRDERCSKETSYSASGGTNEAQFPAGLPLVVGFSDVWSGANSDEEMPRTQGFPSGFLLPGGFSSVSLRLNTCRGLALSRAVRRVLVLHLIALFHRIFLDRIYQPQLNVVKAGQRVQASLGGKAGGRYTHKTDCKCLFSLENNNMGTTNLQMIPVSGWRKTKWTQTFSSAHEYTTSLSRRSSKHAPLPPSSPTKDRSSSRR